MNNKKYYYIANWKMFLTFQNVQKFLQHHHKNLATLTQNHDIMILAPSTESLSLCAEFLRNTPIKLAAQTCSRFSLGAHTGETSAQSLQEIGCSWCIIGHSERRRDHHEQSMIIAQQYIQLQLVGIQPIVCIGEAHQGSVESAIEETQTELSTLFAGLESLKQNISTIFIAYEPQWSIGAQEAAESDFIEKVVCAIAQRIIHDYPHIKPVIFYGGSVTSRNIVSLKNIPHIDGFLIGRASLDFQELEKIVHYK